MRGRGEVTADGVADEQALRVLAAGELQPLGRLATASNITLLCRVVNGGELAVYKPARGETPLWDFPRGTLHRREVAAYVLDQALRWGMVPPTVLRADGPYGAGSAQLFVDHDPGRHYFALVDEADSAVVAQLRRMVLFDIVANNADRKASHVLLDRDGRVRLVDHGICFHEEPKLRTVAWDFAGESVPGDDLDDLADLAARLADPDDASRRALAGLLAPAEVEAVAARADAAADLHRFPAPSGPRPYPWPPL